MRIAVIGATGRTGLAFARLALSHGHEVVAVVRDPARLTVEPTLVRVADALVTRDIASAVDGVDAVVSTVGPGRDAAPDVMEKSALAIIEALRESGPRRVLVVSASGPFTEGDAWLLARVLKPIVQQILRVPFRDITRTDALVQGSGLDWTLVRPPQLSDAPGVRYRRAPRWGLRIGREALAQAMLDELLDPSSIGRVTTVAA